MKLAPDVKLEGISAHTHSFVGAVLAQLCTVALTGVREELDLIDLEEETIDAEILVAMAVSQEHFTSARGSCNPRRCGRRWRRCRTSSGTTSAAWRRRGAACRR